MSSAYHLAQGHLPERIGTVLLKPLFPENVGLWTGGHPPVLLVGFLVDPARPGVREVLGYWIITLGLAAAILSYSGATAWLRRLLRWLRR